MNTSTFNPDLVEPLPLKWLRMDGGTQPRNYLNQTTWEDYAQDLNEGAVLPPATVFHDGENYWLADGYHRVRAAEHLGWDTYPCEVRQGSVEDARWYSYGVNKAHGLRRLNSDKQRAVQAALAHPNAKPLSNYEIADHVGVSESFIRKVKDGDSHYAQNVVSAKSVRTKHGTRTTMNTANIGKSKNASREESVEHTTGLQTRTPQEPRTQSAAMPPIVPPVQVLADSTEPARDTAEGLLREALERATIAPHKFPADWLARVWIWKQQNKEGEP